MDVFITNAGFSVDSTQQGSSYLENKDLLSMSLSVDSLNIKYQDDINTNISRLAIQAKTSPVIDTTAVIPMTAQLKFDYLRTRLPRFRMAGSRTNRHERWHQIVSLQ